jgi:hypothetical protein
MRITVCIAASPRTARETARETKCPRARADAVDHNPRVGGSSPSSGIGKWLEKSNFRKQQIGPEGKYVPDVSRTLRVIAARVTRPTR